MDERLKFRLQDILDSIAHIDFLLSGKTSDILEKDPITKAAFERFPEIISEAARHIPDAQKGLFGEIPWRRIQDLGNHLRQAYNNVDDGILWHIYADGELNTLAAAVQTMMDEAQNTPILRWQ